MLDPLARDPTVHCTAPELVGQTAVALGFAASERLTRPAGVRITAGMPEEALRKAMDAVRTQLQAELDAQLAAIERQHAEALENARREARQDADAHWQAELERVRAELEQARSET